jgi:hypothetical protein
MAVITCVIGLRLAIICKGLGIVLIGTNAFDRNDNSSMVIKEILSTMVALFAIRPINAYIHDMDQPVKTAIKMITTIHPNATFGLQPIMYPVVSEAIIAMTQSLKYLLRVVQQEEQYEQ